MAVSFTDAVRANHAHSDYQLGIAADQASVRQSSGSLLSRAWNCLTRSTAQVAENKATARLFIDEMRAKYGDQVADMASHELQSHLSRGNPLSVRRAEVILQNAEAMRARQCAQTLTSAHQTVVDARRLQWDVATHWDALPGNASHAIDEQIATLEATQAELVNIRDDAEKAQHVRASVLADQIAECGQTLDHLRELRQQVADRAAIDAALYPSRMPEEAPVLSPETGELDTAHRPQGRIPDSTGDEAGTSKGVASSQGSGLSKPSFVLSEQVDFSPPASHAVAHSPSPTSQEKPTIQPATVPSTQRPSGGEIAESPRLYQATIPSDEAPVYVEDEPSAPSRPQTEAPTVSAVTSQPTATETKAPRLLDSATLRASAGEPTPDGSILGLIARPHDTDYKSLLGRLDSYHQMLQKIPLSSDPASTRQAVALLNAQLDEMETLAQKIGDTKDLASLRESLKGERAALARFQQAQAMHTGRHDAIGVPMSLGRAIELVPRMTSGLVDANLQSPMQPLGSGQVNTVFSAQFATPEGTPLAGVVKFDPEHMAVDADVFRGDGDRPELGARTMATSILDRALGTGMIPETRYAVVNGSPATVMARAEGVDTANTEKVVMLSKHDFDAIGRAQAAVADSQRTATALVENHPLAQTFSVRRAGEWLENLLREHANDSPPFDLATAPEGTPLKSIQATEGARYDLSVGPGGTIVATLSEAGRKNHPDAEAQLQLGSLTEPAAAFTIMRDAGAAYDAAVATALSAVPREDERAGLGSFIRALTSLNMDLEAALVTQPDMSRDPATGNVTYKRPKPYDIDYTHPTLLKQLSRLQALDYLTGEKDRHAGNYFVSRDASGNYAVQGIDNDLSWMATRTEDPARFDAPDLGMSHNRGLPPAVDPETATSILAMRNGGSEAVKRELGVFLNETQLAAFQQRLDTFADAIESGQVAILSDEQWSDRTHPAVKAAIEDPARSYAAREREILAEFAQRGYQTIPMP